MLGNGAPAAGRRFQFLAETLSDTRATSASRAACASSPEVLMVTREPGAAASIINPMIDVPGTVAPCFSTEISASNEARGGARMQPSAIRNLDHPGKRTRRHRNYAGFVLSSADATLMYFRPAACAASTSAGKSMSPRACASLMSMGRFNPAITSTGPAS